MGILSALFFLAQGARAQAPVSLGEIARAALERSASLSAEQARSRRAGHEREAARSGFLPRVDGSAGLSAWSDASPKRLIGARLQPDRQSRLELNVEQVVFKGGEVYQGYRQARLSEDAAASALQAGRLEVLHEAGTLAYLLLRAGEALKSAEAEAERRRAHSRAADARSRVGAISDAGRLRAEAEARAAEAEKTEAERTLLEFKRRLERLTGLGLDSGVEAADGLPWPQGGIERLVEEAEASPVVRSADRAARAAQAGVLKERGGFFPGVFAGGVLRRRSESPETLFFVRDESAGFLEARWRLFSGGERLASTRAARAVQDEKKEAFRKTREEARLSVRTSWDRAKSAEKTITARISGLESARAAYDHASKRHAAGLDAHLDLLDAAAALKAAEAGLRSARFARELALLDLHLAVGSIERILL